MSRGKLFKLKKQIVTCNYDCLYSPLAIHVRVCVAVVHTLLVVLQFLILKCYKSYYKNSNYFFFCVVFSTYRYGAIERTPCVVHTLQLVVDMYRKEAGLQRLLGKVRKWQHCVCDWRVCVTDWLTDCVCMCDCVWVTASTMYLSVLFYCIVWHCIVWQKVSTLQLTGDSILLTCVLHCVLYTQGRHVWVICMLVRGKKRMQKQTTRYPSHSTFCLFVGDQNKLWKVDLCAGASFFPF